MDIKVAIGERIDCLLKAKKLTQQKFTYVTDIQRSYLTHVEKGIRNSIDLTTQHINRNDNQRDLEIYSIAIDKGVNKKKG